jgi:hypothetical protein
LSPNSRLGARGRAVLAAGVSLMVATVSAAPAASGASLSGSTTATFTIGVRSVTLRLKPASGKGICPTSLRSGAVSIQLGPNAGCSVPSGVIVVTNGKVPAHVEVVGALALAASDPAHRWTLCGGTGPACSGKNGSPGVNQFTERTMATVRDKSGTTPVLGPPLTLSYRCDGAFAPAALDPCLAAAGQAGGEGISEHGPSSSSYAADYSTVVGWMAAP